MKVIYNRCKVALVKEDGGHYINDAITKSMDLKRISMDKLQLQDEPEEVLIVLGLNNKNRVDSVFEVSRGSLNSSIAEPREILKRLVVSNASKFVVLHNHPSGDTSPSDADKEMSERLKKVGNLMSLILLDFCIVGDDFLSFREEGLLW